MTLVELQTKRDALVAKIADATRRLQTGDTSIEYFDISSMERSLKVLDTEIEKLTTGFKPRIGRVYSSEGL